MAFMTLNSNYAVIQTEIFAVSIPFAWKKLMGQFILTRSSDLIGKQTARK